MGGFEPKHDGAIVTGELCPISVRNVGAAVTLPGYQGLLVVMAETFGEGYTITLPSAATFGCIWVVKATDDAYAVSVALNGSDTVNGETSFDTLTAMGDCYRILSDGSALFVKSQTLTIE